MTNFATRSDLVAHLQVVFAETERAMEEMRVFGQRDEYQRAEANMERIWIVAERNGIHHYEVHGG